MSGLVIIILTLAAIGAIICVIMLSFKALNAFNDLYLRTPKDEKTGLKALLLIPYILVAIWCFVLQVVLLIITLGALANMAGKARDWWHKGM